MPLRGKEGFWRARRRRADRSGRLLPAMPAAEESSSSLEGGEPQYLQQVRHILQHGHRKEDRTGTGTISVFGMQARYSLRGRHLWDPRSFRLQAAPGAARSSVPPVLAPVLCGGRLLVPGLGRHLLPPRSRAAWSGAGSASPAMFSALREGAGGGCGSGARPRCSHLVIK